ncbi:MAG: MATE family efflux transporter [Gammaproteobacteria bacterium]
MPSHNNVSDDAQELLVFVEEGESPVDIVEPSHTYQLLTYSQALTTLLKSTVPYQAARLPFAFLKLGDAIVIGQLPKNQALAAPFNFAYFASIVGMTRGMCTAVGPRLARAFGANDNIAISREYGLGWLVSAELTVVSACLLYLSGPTARLLGISEEVATVVRNYSLAVVPGLIGIHGGTCDQSFFVGINQERWMMVLSNTFSLISIVVGFPIALTTSLGFTGLGLGTSSAALVTLVVGQILLRRKQYKDYYLLTPRFDAFCKEMGLFLKEATVVGALRSLEWFNWAAIVGMMYLTRNNGAILALQVTLQPVSLWNIFAMGQAFITRLSIAKEAGRLKTQLAKAPESQHIFYENIAHHNMQRLTLFSTCLSMTGATLVGSSMVFFPDSYANVFLSEGSIDEEVLIYTQAFMLINGIGIILDSFRQMGIGMLGGVGDVNIPTLISFISMSLIGLSAGGILTLLLDWGEGWLFITRDVGILLASAAVSLRVYSRFKTTLSVSELTLLEQGALPQEDDENAMLLPKKSLSLTDGTSPCSQWTNYPFSFFSSCLSPREKTITDTVMTSPDDEQKESGKKQFK